MKIFKGHARASFGYWLSRLLLLFLALVGLVPFILTLYLSIRSGVDIATDFWGAPSVIQWNNYVEAFKGIALPILRSLLLSGVSVFFLMILTSISAYVFARMEFAGKEIIFTLFLMVMMIPSVLSMTPLFMMVTKLNLLDTWWAVILPWVSWWQVLGVNILRNNYKEIPEALFEAARIEGAGDFYCFTRIAMALSWSALITIAVTAFLGYYNDYIWPTLVLSGGKKLFSMFVVELGSGNSSDLGVTSAAYVLGSIPLIVVMSSCMKYYLKGTMVGAVKG